MNKWRQIFTETKLSEEPYLSSKYVCDECDIGWDDDEEVKCICEDEEEEESEDELQRIEWERIKRR